MNPEPKNGIHLGDWTIIILFAIAKLSIHLLTFNHFELHRDAYLYYAQSEHLARGFIAVPPFIAVVGKTATTLFGTSAFALRFFPALIGSINLIVIGKAVKVLKGGKVALILACGSYLLSPSYLHTNALFQPVAFDHFFWLSSCYAILLLLKYQDPKYWVWIAFAFGIGFLNKYSIAFLIVALAISLAFSTQRKLLFSPYFLIALLIGLVIILPNLIWQYEHNWPVVAHMTELRERQLVHVRISDFIASQFMMNLQAVLIWLTALLVLFFNKKERTYIPFAWMFVIVIALLIAGSGKDYYSLGIYPIFFAFGAVYIEKYVPRFLPATTSFLIVVMIAVFYKALSVDGIPFSSIKKVTHQNSYRWEDGTMHSISQDMADMTGWKEIGTEVAAIYLGLGEKNKDNCDIYAEHYGQAGAVMFYGKKHGIPQPISPNASFIFWSPEELQHDFLIYIHFDPQGSAEIEKTLGKFFSSVELIKTIENPNFRENGTRIYLCETVNEAGKEYYFHMMKDLKDEYKRR